MARLWLTVRHRMLGLHHRRLTIEHVDGVSLIILPDVFNPVVFRTGAFLAHAIKSTSLLDFDSGESPHVLDLGSGSGIGAVFSARRGAKVIAIDSNPEAIRCVKLNAILNRVDDRIEARQGDLFAPLNKEELFDLVLFNPPFYIGKPKDNFDLAWRSENIFARFAAGLCDHLAPQGTALLVLSTDGECQLLLDELEKNRFTAKPSIHRDFGNEIITVYQVAMTQ